MKLYTRTGDDGSTGLFGGQRVIKDDLRVEAYGTVDELNSLLGIAISVCDHQPVADALVTAQHRLFDLGSDLATPRSEDDDPPDPAQGLVRRISDADITEIEAMIDRACADLPELKQFILPGGTELAARLHLARTVCRRAERRCVTLSTQVNLGPHGVQYLNRLSDLLFALARQANHLSGLEDVPWQPARRT